MLALTGGCSVQNMFTFSTSLHCFHFLRAISDFKLPSNFKASLINLHVESINRPYDPSLQQGFHNWTIISQRQFTIKFFEFTKNLNEAPKLKLFDVDSRSIDPH